MTNLFEGGGLKVTLVAGLSHDEVASRISIAHRTGEVCNRALAFYLHDMEARRLHQALGYRSAAHFAHNRLEMSKARAHELLATGAQLSKLPKLDSAFAKGRLSWSKVRRLARVVTPETENAWIERAQECSQQEVEGMVAAANRGDLPADLDRGLPKARFQLRVALDALGHEMFEMAREKLQAELDGKNVADEELIGELVRLFLSSDADGTVKGRKKTDGSLFRVHVDPEQETAASDAEVSAKLRRQVLARDRHQCQSCTGRRSLMIHHVIWRSEGGRTFAGNLVTLCARCHGLVHEETLFVTGVPGRWVFRDRRGRELHGQLPQTEVHLSTESTMVDSERSSPHPITCLDDIPDQVDAAWWRQHEHLFEWSPDGKRIRPRRQPA